MLTDCWGWRARFGILVIDKDPVAETEFWAMAPQGVTIHSARFESPRRPGSDDYGTDPARRVAESPDIARGLDFLGQMRLDAICVCFTTSSFFGGRQFDDSFVVEASRKAHGMQVTTAARAMVLAMRASGMTRPFVILPPWFKQEIMEAGQRYLAEAGFELTGLMRHDLGTGWRDMNPWETWDAGAQWIVRPEDVYQQVRRAVPAGSDGVVIAGNGFRVAEAIAPLEADLGLPVVTSNQSNLWHCLHLARVRAPVEGSGGFCRAPCLCPRREPRPRRSGGGRRAPLAASRAASHGHLDRDHRLACGHAGDSVPAESPG